MNLLTDPWLPVVDQQGCRFDIRLAEIGGREGGPAVDIVTPRADFKGAIYQLLIGVLQTAFAPEDGRQWKERWRNPPSRAQLEEAFRPIETAFNLDTENGTPAFMQDFDLPYEKKDVSIEKLLIEAPGVNTAKHNIDHFVKRDFLGCISSYWAAIALFTLQVNGPPSGGGHKAGLRGSGSVTTLLMPQDKDRVSSLWERIWINVLTKEEFRELSGNHELTGLQNIFPWMIKTRTSEKPGMETYPIDTNPLQMYWPMPRRIRLHWRQITTICGLTGEQSSAVVCDYHTNPRGTKYDGHWVHPLSPYIYKNGEKPNPIKLKNGGIGYRHWLGIAIKEIESSDRSVVPAKIIDVFRDRYLKGCFSDSGFSPRIWAFGYEMEKESAICWHEATMPIFNLELDALDDLQGHVHKMVIAATDVLDSLKSALKSVWFKRPKDAKGDMSGIDANFWATTEPTFYCLLAKLAELAKQSDEEGAKKLLGTWAIELKQSARILFDQYALSSLNEDGDFKRVIRARHGKNGLEHYLNGSKALKALSA